MDFKKVAAILVLSFAPCLCSSISAQAQQPKVCDSEASFGRSDKTLFGKNCGVCHTISGRWKRFVSMPLGGLFDQEQLLTGQPVNEENIRAIIDKGLPGFMPGFRYTLTPSQINELVQFLKVARCKDKN
jgi:mono/diheme cytochrome c family protein